MDIVIEEPLNHFAVKIYQGSRWRYPSMTDVKFLDNQHIVAAHRYGCKVYVIHIDEENKLFTIVDEMQLMHNNKPYQTESFTILDNTIYMLSYSNILTFIDILPDRHLQQRQTFIKLAGQDTPFHGITHKNNIVYVTPSKRHLGEEYIVSYNTLNGQTSNVATLGVNIRVKSLTFLSNGTIVVLVNFKETTSMTDKLHFFNGEIRLYSSDFKVLDSVDIPCTHFDNICSNECTFYATGANLQHGYIFNGNVKGKRIDSLFAYQVHDFPHGIDIMGNKIAYTSYSTSGIHFMDKSQCGGAIESTIIYR
jgi:hypothetical protein